MIHGAGEKIPGGRADLQSSEAYFSGALESIAAVTAEARNALFFRRGSPVVSAAARKVPLFRVGDMRRICYAKRNLATGALAIAPALLSNRTT